MGTTHGAFIVASYGALFVIVGGLTLWLALDHRRQKRALAARERAGGRRGTEQG